MFFRFSFIITLCILLTPGLHTPSIAAPAEVESKVLQMVESPSEEQQLRTLLDTIKEVEMERADLNQRLKDTADTDAAQQIKEQLEQLERRLQDLQIAFEELATGGVNTAVLNTKLEKASFDWQTELEDVVRPLLEELKRLTERPRIIERLKSERALYENRLQIAESAIAGLEKTQASIKGAPVDKALKALLEQWQNQRENAESRLQRINVQLGRLTTSGEGDSRQLITAFQEFASGRGLNLALALGGFALTYVVLTALGRLISGLMNRGRESGTRRMGRVIALLFRILTLTLALFVASFVLYARGDWLLLGLLILLVIGLLWGLRQSLPRYMQEIRILLNMGSVREGERIIYAGTPWKIASLNLYSTLHNPLLRGGILRLPLDKMADLQSRPFAPEEPWFPSRENDIVILDGDIYGKVLLQTPEVVQLKVVGSIKTFAVADYLGNHPRNLSLEGFAVPIVFGLDYCHQGRILTDIVPALQAYLEAQLEDQPFHPYLTNLLVEFNEAAASSLNLLIVAVFTGAGAEYYWPIRRFLQRATVSACNQHGWIIPFNQLTVHLPPTQQPLPFTKDPT